MRRLAFIGILLATLLTPAATAAGSPVAGARSVNAHDGDVPAYLAGADGGVFTFGGAVFYGSLANTRLNAPIVGIASTPSPSGGYYLAGADGGVFAFGYMPFLGSLANTRLDAPIVGIAPILPYDCYSGSPCVPDGYYLVGADGGVFTFGNVPFYGSLAGVHLNAPIVALIPFSSCNEGQGFGIPSPRCSGHPNVTGYYLIGSDGGVFTFGDAEFLGSLGNQQLVAPVVAGEVDTGCAFMVCSLLVGYALVTRDGKESGFGFDSGAVGVSGLNWNQPIVAVVSAGDLTGGCLVAADGSTFGSNGGQCPGSLAGTPLNAPIVGGSYA